MFKNIFSKKAYISSSDVSKNFLDIIPGVPQGLILVGAILFLIYMNDLSKASNYLTEVMFADDTYLFMSHKSIDTIFANF